MRLFKRESEVRFLKLWLSCIQKQVEDVNWGQISEMEMHSFNIFNLFLKTFLA